MTALTPDTLSTTDQGHLSQVQHGSGGFGMSSGKFSGKFSDAFSARVSERQAVLDYRAHFALRWQRFCQANFVSPAHAADVFQVDATTADKWWQGLNAPSGWVVGRAIADPGLRGAVLVQLVGDA